MFSCALPPCSPTRKQSKIARERERKKSLQKGKDRYNIVKGLAEGIDGISFESLLKRRHYLRARNNYLILEPFDDSDDYRKETTFLPLQDMWFEGYFAFESMLNPAYFIRRCGEQLLLQKYENSHFFKEDSSFKLTRKRCIACVHVGSRVWARAEKGCFLRGIVTQMDTEDIYIKLENGRKIKHKRTHPECVVADAVPHTMEVEIGTRVLAKWYNRLDTYYPGTVVAIRRSFFDVRFDDGDRGCNELRELRILRQKDLEEDARKALLPPWSSLDGIPRIGGICIDYGELLETSPSMLNRELPDGKVTVDYESMSPLDSPVERTSSTSEHADTADLEDTDHVENHTMANDHHGDMNHDHDDGVFGFENNYQHLAPELSKGQPRNPSQVSGSSTDSGYHGNHHRQRKTGLWTVANSQHSVCGNTKSQFLSPLRYLSHLHVPGLSDISDVERNLSELSVTSSADSGFKGSGHSFRFQVPGSPIRSGPGRAVPMFKVEEYTWKKEQEHENEAGLRESNSSEEIHDRHQLPNGPVGLETVI
ncbi:uncharacterized protein LOC114960355 isoform X4 [Acropora millepora]|nr:uncharacterized protein LOC114960355 isoform X4 [Acropora millepora]XP_029194546.2 uncharacterized protein LOC114960355 isoform X4 [Acropora millepora]XP_029194547.2 uncharacterized protein LOC114960355 isoform X4 [Acropora millepora]XP_029194548.2 uncharacterized protein LOC114960355 isoform X4 [Acropora millepora]